MTLLSKSDFAVYDLPVAVTTCLGLSPPAGLEQAKPVMDMVKKLIEEVMNKGGDVLEPEGFLNSTAELGLDSSIDALDAKSLETLKDLIDGGITCGSELKSIINRVVAAVKELKTKTPSSPVDAIRFALANSDLFLKDIPEATSNCIPKNADGGFVTREDIRKTFQVIVDEIINASSDKSGKPVSTASFVRTVADFGLDIVSNFDPTGLAALAKEFIQPICGPTSFLGEIDDGAANEALGLRTMGRAFASSSGTWKKAGNGKIVVTFVSVDTYDVVVNVISGGNKITEVKVPKGKTVTWTKNIADLKDKTLYLDRWRPGFFGIPGTGGGSLLLWVPRSSEGGHLELRAQLNVNKASVPWKRPVPMPKPQFLFRQPQCRQRAPQHSPQRIRHRHTRHSQTRRGCQIGFARALACHRTRRATARPTRRRARDALKVTDMGLHVISTFDPAGLASLRSSSSGSASPRRSSARSTTAQRTRRSDCTRSARRSHRGRGVSGQVRRGGERNVGQQQDHRGEGAKGQDRDVDEETEGQNAVLRPLMPGSFRHSWHGRRLAAALDLAHAGEGIRRGRRCVGAVAAELGRPQGRRAAGHGVLPQDAPDAALPGGVQVRQRRDVLGPVPARVPGRVWHGVHPAEQGLHARGHHEGERRRERRAHGRVVGRVRPDRGRQQRRAGRRQVRPAALRDREQGRGLCQGARGDVPGHAPGADPVPALQVGPRGVRPPDRRGHVRGAAGAHRRAQPGVRDRQHHQEDPRAGAREEGRAADAAEVPLVRVPGRRGQDDFGAQHVGPRVAARAARGGLDVRRAAQGHHRRRRGAREAAQGREPEQHGRRHPAPALELGHLPQGHPGRDHELRAQERDRRVRDPRRHPQDAAGDHRPDRRLVEQRRQAALAGRLRAQDRRHGPRRDRHVRPAGHRQAREGVHPADLRAHVVPRRDRRRRGRQRARPALCRPGVQLELRDVEEGGRRPGLDHVRERRHRGRGRQRLLGRRQDHRGEGAEGQDRDVDEEHRGPQGQDAVPRPLAPGLPRHPWHGRRLAAALGAALVGGRPP
ncbi:hypothetical protein PybrP1_012049 [[Pythium] brassicae (nom. inval.)]|nr:hypothetical protein PybrP1_012049 [[Pythium] brassicae (nom. inval.)]